MKKILITVFVFAMGMAVAGAQETPVRAADSLRHETKRRKPYGLNLANELGFSTEQSARWDLISRQSRDRLGALNDDTSLSKDRRKEQTRVIMKEQEKQLQEILTPDQRVKLKELRRQRRQKARK